ncbi:MAG TPA: hypothetical protein VFB00_06550 [Terriglobales bacterium]|nr:hypothetical protein [Terriglobales bacterium]
MALPLTVLVTGMVTLLRNWRSDAELRRAAAQMVVAVRAHLATVLVAIATVTAGGILAIVAIHALTD